MPSEVPPPVDPDAKSSADLPHSLSMPPSWPSKPSHHMIFIFHCFLSFVICNIDRINLSVAILPMSKQYNWSSSTKGLVQSAFFAGYITTQILGGRLSDAHGGRIVLATGVTIWSVCTALTPLAANSLVTLLLIRALLGVGEGVAMPAMNAVVAKWVPAETRARALSFIYSGMYAGSILGLLLTPGLIEGAGWPSVFYVFGAAGLLWVALFLLTTPSERPAHGSNLNLYTPAATDDSRFVDIELPLNEAVTDTHGIQTSPSDNPPSLREIFSRSCVWAIIVAHFCCTWGYFVLLTWLPSYLYMRYNLDVTESSLFSATPWVAMFIFANVGGSLADGMIMHGVSITHTRKTMQSIGFLGPAVFLGVLCTATGAVSAMVYVTFALAFASFSQSGVYANHQDIGPGIAGTLLGISNTFASLPGLIGVYVTGVVLDITSNNWNVVFGIAIFFYLVGFVVYNLLGTSERQW